MTLNDKLRALNEDLFLRILEFIKKEDMSIKSIKFKNNHTYIEYYDNKEWLDIAKIKINNKRYYD